MGETSGDGQLAAACAALGGEARLRLLRDLCAPRSLRDVPNAEDLDRLVEASLAVEHFDASGERTYVLDPARLFSLAEELRALAQLRLTIEVALAARDAPTPRSGEETGVSTLVLVHGVEIGREYPLAPRRADRPDTWVIGRARGYAVALDHDASLSDESAIVTLEADAHVVHDLGTGASSTRVNFRDLPRGGAHRLETGDLLGVGASLLLYRRGDDARAIRAGRAGRSPGESS